ncbi:MAG: SulP family inorganic anion transporter [Saprospiraceae bacterium]|nr:SulP family inorganic anion transporter [Saprospiraceae bacterium]
MQKQLLKHTKQDFFASIGLALVALPLVIGIAIASDAPVMAGIWAVLIPCVIATLVRGSEITINGPSAGLITVVALGIADFGGGLDGFKTVMAATIFAGGIQVLFGLLRLGRIGDMVPAAVSHGMLGAVGLIIISDQAHVALGVPPPAEIDPTKIDNHLDALVQIPASIQAQNPIIAMIAIISLLVLVGHNTLKNKIVQFVPAPIWIIALTIPIVFLFDFYSEPTISILGTDHTLKPDFLVGNILKNPTEEGLIIQPSFDHLSELKFWILTLTIVAVSSIETLVSAKAVDKMDPLQRQTNLDRELLAVGLSNIGSGFIGGLPVITAIPVYEGAKTRLSNFFFGAIMLIVIVVFSVVVAAIPLAALAVLLLFTAYRLASPKILLDTFRKGDDQFLILMATSIATLVQDLLFGIVVGIAMTLFIHFVKSNLDRKTFLKFLRKPSIDIKYTESIKEYYIEVDGVINFINIPQLKTTLRRAAKSEQVILDLSSTRLVDFTVMEYLHDYAEKYDIPGVSFDIVGLGAHETSSRHPNATRVLPDDKKPQLTRRQQSLEELSQKYNGQFWPETRWEVSTFKDFQFFLSRQIEYKFNTAKGNYKMFFEWETCDLTFQNRVGFNTEERYTSIALFHLPFNAPKFIIDHESLLDKIGMKLSVREQDINFDAFPNFSERFILQGPDEKAIRDFFGDGLIQFLEQNEEYHIECNGTVVLILRNMRFASPTAMDKMHKFNQELANTLMVNWREKALDLGTLL